MELVTRIIASMNSSGKPWYTTIIVKYGKSIGNHPSSNYRRVPPFPHPVLSQAEAPGISVAEVEALVLSVAGEVTGHSVDAQDASCGGMVLGNHRYNMDGVYGCNMVEHGKT